MSESKDLKLEPEPPEPSSFPPSWGPAVWTLNLEPGHVPKARARMLPLSQSRCRQKCSLIRTSTSVFVCHYHPTYCADITAKIVVGSVQFYGEGSQRSPQLPLSDVAKVGGLACLSGTLSGHLGVDRRSSFPLIPSRVVKSPAPRSVHFTQPRQPTTTAA